MRSLVTLGAHAPSQSASTRRVSRLLAVAVAGCSLAALLLAATVAQAATAPKIVELWAENAAVSTAVLKAYVEPGEAETTYRFEYGTDASYGTSAPVPDGVIAADAFTVLHGYSYNFGAASAMLSGLRPGTTYHYRIVATNQEGSTTSTDQVFTTYSQPESGQVDNCPNASFRVGGLSESLPDCRAYELVSPVDKNGGDVVAESRTNVAAESGNAIAYSSHTGFGDTTGSGGGGMTQYVAFRTAAGWVTHGVTPAPAVDVTQSGIVAPTVVEAFSSELDHALVEGVLPNALGGAPNEINLYLEDTRAQSLEVVTRNESGVQAPFRSLWSSFRGGSGDFGVLTFESSADLLASVTESNKKLYALEHGILKLAGVLPDGSMPAGGSGSPREHHEAAEVGDTVSRDGSRLLFISPTDGSAPPQLYMRKNGVSTVRISESEPSALTSEPQNVRLQAATPDMSKVVFSSTDRLLESDPGGPGYGLYLYTDGPNPESELNLTFIARVGNNSGGRGLVAGVSEDGSRVYYYNNGEEVDFWDSGRITLVYRQVGGQEPPRISADGRRLAFAGQGEFGLNKGIAYDEMYLYDETSGLTCVSCPQSGAAPTTNVEQEPLGTGGIGYAGPFIRHYLSRDGRYVFFTTATALVPQDTNGLPDAYEYDANTGRISLLSSGTGDTGSWFVEASASGHDVFIATRQALNRWDVDKLMDLYDVRVDGGLPEPPEVAAPCAGDECQGVPSAAPTFSTSSGFSGLGNIVPANTAKPRQKSASARALARQLAACRRKPKRIRARCAAKVRSRSRSHKTAKRAARRAGR